MGTMFANAPIVPTIVEAQVMLIRRALQVLPRRKARDH
jgi:hypothetical protein